MSEELLIRECPLCRKRIADGCPNTLEHVTAQRDHYWDCLKRLETAFDNYAKRFSRHGCSW